MLICKRNREHYTPILNWNSIYFVIYFYFFSTTIAGFGRSLVNVRLEYKQPTQFPLKKHTLPTKRGSNGHDTNNEAILHPTKLN